MTAERVLITIDASIEPTVEQSTYEIASAVVLEALHACGIFPTRFVVESHPDPARSER